jgi:UDP-N-acetylmuramoyl-tripeptide--D-alanyl-D-alanine ligase
VKRAVAIVALTAGFVAHATAGRLVSGEAATVFAGVSTDTRTLPAGALFVALTGPRFDGHAFAGAAVARGATGLVVSRPVDAPGVAVIAVPDTLVALQALGREVRRQSGATVIVITGSAGKTTTKELSAALLGARYRVVKNAGNLNNHIGLPLSLTELSSGPDLAVMELGMNHPGEIRALIGIAEPDVRVWTNVGDAHLGAFQSREAVALAKAEVLEGAGDATLVVANADDALVMAHVRRTRAHVLTFGEGPGASVRATGVEDRGVDGTGATVETPAGVVAIDVPLPGRAHLQNALAAVAIASAFSVPLDRMAAIVASFAPVARRGQVVRLASGTRVVDDSYNASPSAVQAMLQALAATPQSGRRVAVLGEMQELGTEARALHERCGRAAAEAGVEELVVIGGVVADGLASGAIQAGLRGAHVHRYYDSASAAARVPALIRPGDLVLVKGSRSTRTDLVADALVGAGAA